MNAKKWIKIIDISLLALVVVLILLKVFGVINLGWFFVTMPIWIIYAPIAIIAPIVLLVITLTALYNALRKIGQKNDK